MPDTDTDTEYDALQKFIGVKGAEGATPNLKYIADHICAAPMALMGHIARIPDRKVSLQDTVDTGAILIKARI